jgi:septum formation protein
MRIILGSASPRRRQLLTEIFGSIEVRTKDFIEDFPPHLVAAQIALYLAEEKAKTFNGQLNENELLLTSDTIVWLHDHVLNKPADRNEALLMLKKLSGRSHEVYTGVCISTTAKRKCFYTRSVVWFQKMKDADLMEYIDQYKPFDKAGAYGAQECLPEGMNPLSEKEKAFLKKIGKQDLFEKSLAVKDHAKVPLIEKIEGSYFNVMGLPVAELYDEMQKDFSELAL